ncbi:DUF4180 domain-containing protein [Actinomadura formosensis]|uniref:DUF4180 domain-containing protein n=1 Tax=Actinomadura formosensis TaxID=60706 RepID=UPI00082DD863|nr:DUF4180 domain-containing protein [Actinomadura formosensis]
MADLVQERAGMTVLVCAPDGPPISTVDDALELIGASFLGAEVVAVPAARLDEQFFSLGTRLAGEIMQKFVTYRLRLAIVGDIGRWTAASPALAALVRESNTADHVWFVPDLHALDARLREIA